MQGGAPRVWVGLPGNSSNFVVIGGECKAEPGEVRCAVAWGMPRLGLFIELHKMPKQNSVMSVYVHFTRNSSEQITLLRRWYFHYFLRADAAGAKVTMEPVHQGRRL